jgi:hypothetical protein
VGHLGLHPLGGVHLDVHRSAMCVWGAWDGVRPDATADAFPALLPHLQGVDARKSGDPARDVPAQGGCPSGPGVVLLPDVLARNKPDAHPSVA